MAGASTRRLWPRLLLPTVPPLSTRRTLPHITLSRVLAGGPDRPVTYPSSLLDCKVWIALGADLTQPWWTWAWEDITRFVRHSDGITVTDGRKDEASLVTPGKGSLRLDNRDGRFSRRNPTGPYYGLLTKNTPILAVVDPGSGQVPRMEMYVTEWPTRSDRSLTDVTVPIVCAGILRRLAQGTVLKSPLRRAILAASPTAYWPLEDGPEATFGSVIGSGSNLTAASGTIEFGVGGPLPGGASAAADFSGGASGVADTGIPTGTADVAGWEFECTFGWDVLPSFALSQSYLIAGVETPGSSTLKLGVGLVEDGGQIMRMIWGWNGTTLASAWNTSPGGIVAGQTYQVTIRALQNGAETRIHYWFDGVYVDAAIPFVTANLTNPTRLLANPAHVLAGAGNGKANPSSLSHLAIWSVARSNPATTGGTVQTGLAADGYVGEMAHVRIARLCDEESVTFTGTASSSPPMGPQTTDSFLANLRACEAVDGGVLYERSFGLGYQSRAERHNAPVALTLDFNQGHIAVEPEHADDDQLTRNRWTISRINGSEATVEDATSIAANGLYDDSAELNVESDDDCVQQASWRVHKGTVEEERWPRFDIDFASTGGRTVIPTWLALPFGPRLNVLNPPDMYSPDPVDAFIEGREEKWDPVNWNAGIYTTPARPFDIHVVADTTGNRGRVDAANSTLAADATAGATTFSVASTGALWQTGATSFDLEVGGERVTVTNITGGSSPQAFTVSRSQNGVVKAQTAGTTVRLWRPGVYAL